MVFASSSDSRICSRYSSSRKKENAFCCGAGRGTRKAFPEFARWAAEQRLAEVREIGAEALVSSCPWCKNNFAQVAGTDGDNLKVYDIAELILASVGT